MIFNTFKPKYIIPLLTGLALASFLGWGQPLNGQQIFSGDYLGRLGLFEGDEFTRTDGYQKSTATGLTESGYARGTSQRYDGDTELGVAVWVADTSSGETSRLGFFSGPEFTRTDGFQTTNLGGLTETGYAYGNTQRYVGNSSGGQALWIADAATGVTTRVGFFNEPEYMSSSGFQTGSIAQMTASGYARGTSQRYDGNLGFGTTVWVANVATGITTRLGLFSEPEFTREDGFQTSAINGLTESGYLVGNSTRFDGSSSMGFAAWVADAESGVTTRLAAFNTPQYTRSDGYQFSVADRIIESGYVQGRAIIYDGESAPQADIVWVMHLSNQVATRLGLFSGVEFTRSDGYQASAVDAFTESGYLWGTSTRYNGDFPNAGQAAWAADAESGVTTRVGLSTGAEFTRSDGYQHSSVSDLTESGYAWGVSLRYEGASSRGQAAWLADVASGVTTRLGLFSGPEYTSANNNQHSAVTRLTESGYALGVSFRYDGNVFMGQAAWTADATSGLTTRVGLFTGPEFTRADGYQSGLLSNLTESGYASGRSERYLGGNVFLGSAAWVADASSGVTTRLGLFTGPEFTREDGYQLSIVGSVTESGYVRGVSARYDGSADMGQAPWAADVASGVTTRLGLFSDPEFTRADGYQFSAALEVTESGFIRGYSTRYDGATAVGRTSWIWQFESEQLYAINLSVRDSDGYAFSSITTLTEEGLAVGYYTLFAPDDTELGDRAFVWTSETGAVALEETISGGILQYGWEAFTNVTYSNGQLILVGSALTGFDGEGVFAIELSLVPEPGTYSLLIGALVLSLAILRRRKAN